MWAVVLGQESVALFMEWGVGKLLRDLCMCFVKAELSAPHPSILLPFFSYWSYLELERWHPSRLKVWT